MEPNQEEAPCSPVSVCRGATEDRQELLTEEVKKEVKKEKTDTELKQDGDAPVLICVSSQHRHQRRFRTIRVKLQDQYKVS